MKLIDCCMFNGDEIIKMRLEYYYNFFDTFYFIESWYTFSGKRKEFLYCEKYADWFAPYKDKVKFHILNDFHSLVAFEQEEHQRNSIVPRILAENEDAIVFFSDCDEFYDLSKMPSVEELTKLTKEEGKSVHFAMKFYYCRFTHRLPTYVWTNAYAIHTSTLGYYNNIQTVRIQKTQNGIPIKAATIENGWHFTYFMSVADILRKIESFSHQELNTPAYKNETYIRKAIHEGRDIFRRDIQISKIPFDDPSHGYPEVFRKYHERLETGEGM